MKELLTTCIGRGKSCSKKVFLKRETSWAALFLGKNMMTSTTNLYHGVKIGSLVLPGNLFLAPVAGYSDRAFRSVCYEGGADFAYTEMVSAEALYRGSDKTHEIMKRAHNEKNLAVQLFGGDCHSMAEAIKIVVQSVNPQLIDLNAGCPVPKIVKTGAGSSLTRDPDRLFAITKVMVETLQEIGRADIPVTVKIRSGWDSSSLTWKEAAHAALDAGAQAITLHGRTRSQGYEGKADWSILENLVSFVKETGKGIIPVFGSGDVFSPEDALRMLQQTHCDGVMFARGAMGNPFIFEETKQLIQTGSYEKIPPERRIKAGMEELAILVADKGENLACREMRKRFCAYSKGLSGGAQLRTEIISAVSVDDYKKIFSPLL